MASDLNEENIKRSARTQMIIETIERALEKMMFVEANIGKELDQKDIFHVKREGKTAITELKIAIQLLTGQLDI